MRVGEVGQKPALASAWRAALDEARGFFLASSGGAKPLSAPAAAATDFMACHHRLRRRWLSPWRRAKRRAFQSSQIRPEDEASMRTASLERNTNETRIRATLALDGSGSYDVKTGVGFLDHMLEQLSRHSLIDIHLRVDGDLHVDAHHTTEDSGIVLGQAVAQALGDRRGIQRYGAALVPMDEALTRVALDLSNRPYLVWNVGFTRDKLGDFDTELFKEWFQAFAFNAGMTLHVENLYGSNNHHIIESTYKALARALRKAIEIDPRKADAIPSTKGAL